jgi:hypothetical protein
MPGTGIGKERLKSNVEKPVVTLRARPLYWLRRKLPFRWLRRFANQELAFKLAFS